jgi:hypothetical protein
MSDAQVLALMTATLHAAEMHAWHTDRTREGEETPDWEDSMRQAYEIMVVAKTFTGERA